VDAASRNLVVDAQKFARGRGMRGAGARHRVQNRASRCPWNPQARARITRVRTAPSAQASKDEIARLRSRFDERLRLLGFLALICIELRGQKICNLKYGTVV
jgi:hypothetical protein